MRAGNLRNILKLLIVTLGLTLFFKTELYVSADLKAIRLWDDGVDSQFPCYLSHGVNDGKNRSTLTGGDPYATCRIQVTTSNQFHGVLIQVPRQISPGTSMYIERPENMLPCQNKYILITTDKGPCYAVIPNSKLQIVLQGSASVNISDIATDHLLSVCQENQANYNDIQKSELIDVKVCPMNEFNDSISCTALSNYSYTCDFLSDCFIILRNNYVGFQCSGVQSNHSALLIYPSDTTELHLSNQNIIKIAENAFSSVKRLRELHLDHSKISEVHPQAFVGLQNLTVLSLSNGKLEHLPRGVLKGLKNLETLKIDVNDIISLEGDLFNETKKLEYLTLEENKLTSLPNGLLKGLVNLETLIFDQNQISSSQTDLFNETRQLRYLTVNKNELTHFPSVLLKGLVNLETLNLRENQIVFLDSHLFNNNNKLQYINLKINNLKHLPKGLFKGLINLETLKLSSNQINSLESDLFNETGKLQYLTLNENALIYLPSGVFKGLINLEKLKLSDNQITSLESSLFNETGKLEYLTLYGNNLTYLPNGLFKGLINLETLKLDDNKIILVEAHLFNETGKLEFLSLARNKLTYLPNGLFKGLINLEVFRVHENQIIQLEAGFFNETLKLEVLNMDDNNLTHIPYGLFKGLVNLEEIHLKRNKLSTLGRELLTDMYSLLSFTVSGNNLISLEPDLFNNTSNLEWISISDNKLRHLTNQLFRGLHKLAFIFAQGNMLTSLDSTLFQGLSSVRILALSRNKLRDIKFDLLWDLKALEYFDAGDNQLTHIDPTIFDKQTELQILRLYRNRFQTIDKRVFQNNAKLEFLDLSHNQLTRVPNLEHLTNLIYFNLIGNELTMIDKYTFSSLPKQVLLTVNQTEICECFVPNDLKQCRAVDVRSPYLTCERLMSDRVLVAMSWIIGLNAIGGNVYVISRRCVQEEKGGVQTFLLSNLAMSDLLMGVYMIIIVSADSYFGEYFPMQAESWRSGITCRISGALSIMSSEASVLFIVLITIDRFINIRFPYSQYKLRKNSSAIVAALIWLTSITIGMIPSILAGQNEKFYDNSHVCIGLPLAQIEHFAKNVSTERIILGNLIYEKYLVESKSLGYIPGLYYASAVFLGLNCMCFILILLCYVEIIRYATNSSKNLGVNSNTKEIRMAVKVAAIVLTDFFCWSPIIILGILVQCNVIVLPASVFAWCVTFVLPINSAINPYLYTIAAVIADRRKNANKHIHP